jgi:hypothetical protein
MSVSLRPIKGEPGKFFNVLTGKVIMIIEWREDDKYDTVYVEAGAIAPGANFNFFRDLQGKDLIDTNFTTQRRLPAGEEMILDRIGVKVPMAFGNTLAPPADHKRILENGYMKFTINRKDTAEGPLTKFPPGYGLAGNTVETGQGIVSNGVASTAAAAKLVREQYITTDHDLDAVIWFYDRQWATGVVTMPTTTEDLVIQVFLHGLIKAAATK